MIHLGRLDSASSPLFTFSLLSLANLCLSILDAWKLPLIVNTSLPLTVCIQSPYSPSSSVLSPTFQLLFNLPLSYFQTPAQSWMPLSFFKALGFPFWPLIASFFPLRMPSHKRFYLFQVQSLLRFSSNLSGTRNLSLLCTIQSKAQIYRLYGWKIQTYYTLFLELKKTENLRYSKHEVITINNILKWKFISYT